MADFPVGDQSYIAISEMDGIFDPSGLSGNWRWETPQEMYDTFIRYYNLIKDTPLGDAVIAGKNADIKVF